MSLLKDLRRRFDRPPRLSGPEVRAVKALARTVFPKNAVPGDDGMDLAGDEAQVVAYIEELLERLPRREQVMIRALFLGFEGQSLFFHPLQRSRFSSLPRALREEDLERWDKSPYYFGRLLFQAMRGILLWAYVDKFEVGQEMGVEDGTQILKRDLMQQQGAEPHAASADTKKG